MVIVSSMLHRRQTQLDATLPTPAIEQLQRPPANDLETFYVAIPLPYLLSWLRNPSRRVRIFASWGYAEPPTVLVYYVVCVSSGYPREDVALPRKCSLFLFLQTVPCQHPRTQSDIALEYASNIRICTSLHECYNTFFPNLNPPKGVTKHFRASSFSFSRATVSLVCFIDL